MFQEIIKCDCCGDEVDGDSGMVDDQLGVLCPICNYRCIEAQKQLFNVGIKRPVCSGDINDSNFKRFQIKEKP